MTLWHIAWSYLWNRKFTTAMSIVSLALSVGLITAVLTLRSETQRRFEEEGQAFDMVIGAKGNPLQLVLSAVYFLDQPTGNVLLSDYEKVKDMWGVEAAYPIGLGDTFRGYSLVGVTPDFFDFRWGGGERGFTFAQGRPFEKDFEAVLGAQAAEDVGLRVGDTFFSTHGHSAGGVTHDKHPYTIVGILDRTGSPNDRAVFTSLDSIWAAHDHPEDEDAHEEAGHEEGEHHHSARDEVTAVLVKLRSPAMRFEFKDTVNQNLNAMAVIPVMEIQKLYEQLLGTAKAVLMAIGYLVVVISAITIMIGLYMAILARKRDLAVMRALGASQGEIFGSVIIEAFWVALLGIGAGWAVGAAACWVLGRYLAQRVGFHISAWYIDADLLTAFTIVLVLGMLAGVIPAAQAYRTNVARDLAEL